MRTQQLLLLNAEKEHVLTFGLMGKFGLSDNIIPNGLMDKIVDLIASIENGK